MNIPEISVQELQALHKVNANIFILDVRNPDEYAICNLAGHLIPLNELPSRLHELDPEHHIIVHCHAGGRSRRTTEFLIKQGFNNICNLRGGITAWANKIDPKIAKY